MDRSRCSDAQLLTATPADPQAFAEFYRRYEEAMLAFMLRRTRTAEVAADLTAEVFARALETAARYSAHEGPAAGWLFGIARNVLFSSYRQARVQDATRKRLGMPRLELTDELVENLERVGDTARGEEALALLAHLPDEQRDAVQSRVLDERDYPDIAGELACSASVVRKRVSRGLSALRAQLSRQL